MSTVSPTDVDAAVDAVKKNASVAGSSSDPVLIDAMFKAAEYMSRPPSGGVSFRAFKTLGPIATLLGPRESDLSVEELNECW